MPDEKIPVEKRGEINVAKPKEEGGETLGSIDGENFLRYLHNKNTIITLSGFQNMVSYFKENPKIAIQIIFSTTNCIDGRPVMLHNSSILLLKFLAQNNRKYNEELLESFIDSYLNDPIRKEWFNKQDKRKISKDKIVSSIKKYYEKNTGYSELGLTKNDFDLVSLVELLTEGSGYPGGGLGFVINYTDMLVKNRNEIARMAGITEKKLMEKIDNFYKDYGHFFYYHSCDNVYGGSCKYDGCAAMKYFMGDQSIDSSIQGMVNKHILGKEQGNRRSTILNGKHDEKNRITIIKTDNNNLGIGVRNDISTDKELGTEQSFVLNLQLESIKFDAISSILFPDADQDLREFLREKSTASLKNHLVEINKKLGEHKIKIGTIINYEPNTCPAIDDIGVLLDKI